VLWPFHRVLLVRHGETEWNVAHRRQGQLDSPLTPRGINHAEQLAAAICAKAVDGIFTSPLGRAHRTASIIDAKVRCGVAVVEELVEVHHGSFAGLTNDEIETHHPGELLRRERDKYLWRFPEGESYADAEARASVALQRIVGVGAAVPLLVTHEMIGRMVLRTLLDLTPREALDRSMPHGAVIEVVPARGTLHDPHDLARDDL
jgi:broad specificity phosphatase PhoE